MKLEYLIRPRAVLERLAPAFDADLCELPLHTREAPGSGMVQLFKERGPVDMLIPQSLAGGGADIADAVDVQIAIASRSPSLAVATTMHQFSIATLMAMQATGDGTIALMLEAVARNRLLVASGFAEGVPGRGVLESGLQVREVDEGVYLSGSKKPCSMSETMDLLTASYVRETGAGDELMIALIPARSPGLSVRKYWHNTALAGAESHEVVLEDVFVSRKMVVSGGLKKQLDRIQIVGFQWFELLISAAYTGMCAGLVEQAILAQRGTAAERVELVLGLQLAGTALQGMARDIVQDDSHPDAVLGRLLLVRYAVEQQLATVSDKAMRMMGGTPFITAPDLSNYLVACRGLAFHPPARSRLAESLDAFIRGEAFSMSTGA